MDYLERIEEEAIYIIREAYARYDRLAVLWSTGKDSTLLLWLCRRAFLGRLPVPVIHIDTGFKFAAVYEFRDRLAAEWNLDLQIVRNETALANGVCPEDTSTLQCCHALKTTPLQDTITRMGLDAVIVGIRSDEHGIRAKERFVSPRQRDFTWTVGKQPPELWDMFSAETGAHDRIHPLLHMTELDIWLLTRRANIPINPLYFAQEGWRFRSIGCEPCCVPIPSQADTIEAIIRELELSPQGERRGRSQDKDGHQLMQKLRSLGYM